VVLRQISYEYCGFPCQFSFHQMFHIHLSSGAGTIGQLVVDVPSELSLMFSHENEETTHIIKYLIRFVTYLLRRNVSQTLPT
jgi:hypothetical protein